MHIAFAASECVPYSKTGGLADVVGALPRALAALGHQVSVYVPRYRQTKLADPQTVVRSVTIPYDDKYRFCSVVTAGTTSGVRTYFVEYPPYFDRESIYGTAAGDYPDQEKSKHQPSQVQDPDAVAKGIKKYQHQEKKHQAEYQGQFFFTAFIV